MVHLKTPQDKNSLQTQMSVFANTHCHRIFKSKNSSLLVLNLGELSTNRQRALWGISQEPLCSTSGLQVLTSHAFHQLLLVLSLAFISNLCEAGAVERVYRPSLLDSVYGLQRKPCGHA